MHTQSLQDSCEIKKITTGEMLNPALYKINTTFKKSLQARYYYYSLPPSFYRRGNRGSKRVSNLPKILEPLSGGIRRAQATLN